MNQLIDLSMKHKSLYLSLIEKERSNNPRKYSYHLLQFPLHPQLT